MTPERNQTALAEATDRAITALARADAALQAAVEAVRAAQQATDRLAAMAGGRATSRTTASTRRPLNGIMRLD